MVIDLYWQKQQKHSLKYLLLSNRFDMPWGWVMMTDCSFITQLVHPNNSLLWMYFHCVDSGTRAQLRFIFSPKSVQVWVLCRSLCKSFLYVPRIFMLKKKKNLTKHPCVNVWCGMARFLFCRSQVLWFLWVFLCFEAPWAQTGSCPQDGDIDQNTGRFLVAWLNGKWYAFRSSWEAPSYMFGSHNYNVVVLLIGIKQTYWRTFLMSQKRQEAFLITKWRAKGEWWEM